MGVEGASLGVSGWKGVAFAIGERGEALTGVDEGACGVLGAVSGGAGDCEAFSCGWTGAAIRGGGCDAVDAAAWLRLVSLSRDFSCALRSASKFVWSPRDDLAGGGSMEGGLSEATRLAIA